MLYTNNKRVLIINVMIHFSCYRSSGEGDLDPKTTPSSSPSTHGIRYCYYILVTSWRLTKCDLRLDIGRDEFKLFLLYDYHTINYDFKH